MKIHSRLCFLACLSVAGQAQGAPTWLQSLPESPGRIFAVGSSAITSNEAKAMELAAQNARFEVVARLKATVVGTTTINQTQVEQKRTGAPAAGSRQQYVRQESTTSIQAIDLPGLVISDRYLDRAGRSAYALAYLDVAAADQSLRDGLDGLRSEWARFLATPADPGVRSTISHLQAAKTLQAKAALLDSQAGLLVVAGLDPNLNQGAKEVGREITAHVEGVRRSLVIGARVEGGMLGDDVLAVIRNAVIAFGFVWDQTAPSLVLSVKLRESALGTHTRQKTWWEVDAHNPERISVRASLRISISDTRGNEQDSFTLNVKGVSRDQFRAEQELIDALKEELPPKLKAFLATLTR